MCGMCKSPCDGGSVLVLRNWRMTSVVSRQIARVKQWHRVNETRVIAECRFMPDVNSHVNSHIKYCGI